MCTAAHRVEGARRVLVLPHVGAFPAGLSGLLRETSCTAAAGHQTASALLIYVNPSSDRYANSPMGPGHAVVLITGREINDLVPGHTHKSRRMSCHSH